MTRSGEVPLADGAGIPRFGDTRPPIRRGSGRRRRRSPGYGSTTANPPRGGGAKHEVSQEIARLPNPGNADDGRKARMTRGTPAALLAGPLVMVTFALALGGTGTSQARLDPNRNGQRAVNAAGGSAISVAVRFTVRPVLVLVVAADGRPLELWTNLRGQPRPGRAPVLLAWRGSAGGPALVLTPELRRVAQALAGVARFGRPGRIW